MFSAAKGGPVRHHNFYMRHYKPAVVRAELPEALRFHRLGAGSPIRPMTWTFVEG